MSRASKRAQAFVLRAFTYISMLPLVAFLPGPPTIKAENVDRPNILIILADDLGYGDLSSYGATDLRSPNIDHLVSSGIRFDNFYAN